MDAEKLEHTPEPWNVGEHLDRYLDDRRGWYIHDMQVAGATIAAGIDYYPHARLIALAPTAPHSCADPACPGQRNQARLAAAEEMAGALKRLTSEVQDYPAWQRPCDAVDVARAALALWKEAG